MSWFHSKQGRARRPQVRESAFPPSPQCLPLGPRLALPLRLSHPWHARPCRPGHACPPARRLTRMRCWAGERNDARCDRSRVSLSLVKGLVASTDCRDSEALTISHRRPSTTTRATSPGDFLPAHSRPAPCFPVCPPRSCARPARHSSTCSSDDDHVTWTYPPLVTGYEEAPSAAAAVAEESAWEGRSGADGGVRSARGREDAKGGDSTGSGGIVVGCAVLHLHLLTLRRIHLRLPLSLRPRTLRIIHRRPLVEQLVRRHLPREDGLARTRRERVRTGWGGRGCVGGWGGWHSCVRSRTGFSPIERDEGLRGSRAHPSEVAAARTPYRRPRARACAPAARATAPSAPRARGASRGPARCCTRGARSGSGG